MSDNSQELVPEMEEWVVEIEARSLSNLDISHAPRASTYRDNEEQPSIFGIWECWDDFGASFIPETKKWQSVACMMQYFGLNVRSYLEYMQTKVDIAWSYYDRVDEQFRAVNSKRFIEHLLVNSCFLILAMVFISGKEDLDDILDVSIPKGQTIEEIQKFILADTMRIRSYMLTMKYQIPWFVVEAVYTEFSNLSRLFDTPIHKLALAYFYSVRPREHPSKKDGGTVPEGGFKHLLHIFHWSRVPEGKYLVDTTSSDNFIARFHIPSARDLQLSKIVFINDEGGSIDVSYYDKRKLHGVMQLTPWHLLHYSPQLYQSLLRFEEGYGFFCGLSFTAYVACMTCLLKEEADVRILRANGIIPITSFDDKDVLLCTQELKSFIFGNLQMPDDLIILEKVVIVHHQRSAYSVYGEFKSRYRELITISAIGCFLIFVLTLIQAVVGILSLIKK